MSCDDCQTWLVDLACDTLPAEQRATVEAHVQGCERCRADLEMLREGLSAAEALPRLVVPEGVRAHVLAAAGAESASTTAAPPVTPARPPGAPPLDWLSRIAEWAALPQVAMVAVLMLMIAVGLYHLPAPEPEGAAEMSALAEPQVANEPSGAATAIPLPEEADSDDGAPLDRAEELEAEAEPEPMPQRAERAAFGKGQARSKGETASLGRAQNVKEKAAPRPRPSKKASEATSRMAPGAKRSADALLDEAAAAERAAAPASAKPSPTSSASSAPRRSRARASSGAGGGAMALEDLASAPAEADREMSSDEGTRTLALARDALAAGRPEEAARLSEASLRRGGSPLEAHALAAQAHQRAGSCAKAVPHYRVWRELLGRLPPAWPQAVACFASLGDTAAVDAWLSAADKQDPQTAERVRRSLRSKK